MEYKGYAKVAHPDKVNTDAKKIATQIFAKINLLNEKAEKEGYPFEYTPEKDEYCFLISKGYPNKDVIDEEVINTDLQDMYKDKCNELQKQNFNFEDQFLVVKHLKDTPKEKRDDVLKLHIKLQKDNFSLENQFLIFENLKNVPEHKYDKIIHSHNILNDGKEHQNSEINDAVLCIRGISDEC